MKRDIYRKLLEWKESSSRKPLILKGARQVGKTYILREFSRNEYESEAYLNFEEDPRIKEFFEATLKPNEIIKKLSIYLGKKISKNTLIIFDEIQCAPNAINSLKYFCEFISDQHVIAAGSLLGVSLNEKSSFPVGKVNFLEMYPLSFYEFLTAIGKNDLRTYLQEQNSIIPIEKIFHEEALEILKTYYFVGGMPEVINKYLESDSFDKARKIQKEILASYVMDFSKHVGKELSVRIMKAWDSLPAQLAKENKKFKYSLIGKNARARDYEDAVTWLVRAGLVYRVENLKAPKKPLSAYVDSSFFKVYLFDCGILGALSNLSPKTIINNDSMFSEFKGAISENFVMQELISSMDSELFYWSKENLHELEFILDIQNNIYPLEVKFGISRKKKSIKFYDEKFNPSKLFRVSKLNLKQDGKFINIPLYLVSNIINFSYTER